MDYDAIFDEIGHFGRWQQLNFLVGSLCIVGASFMCFMFTFIGFIPKFRCYIPECDGSIGNAIYDANFTSFAIPGTPNEDEIDGQYHCTRYIYRNISETNLISWNDYSDNCFPENFNQSISQVCHQHVYDDTQYRYPITVELDLSPCEASSDYWNLEPLLTRTTFISMLFMVGQFGGSLTYGILADKIGRKKSLVFAILTCSLTSLIQAFIKDFWAYAFLRMIVGFGSVGIFTNVFVICMETTGSKYATELGILIAVPYAVGEMIVALAAYLLQNWQTFQITLSALVILLAPLVAFILPESPRWLVAKRKREKAIDVFSHGSKINNNPFFSRDRISQRNEEITASNQTEDKDDNKNRLGFKSFFKETVLFKNVVIISTNCLVATLCYYGITFNSVNFGGLDIYLSFALSGLTEIIGVVFIVFFLDHLGRRTILIGGQFITGIMCIAANFLQEASENGALVCTLIGKMASSAVFQLIFLYAAELFPTLIRNTALGFSNTASGLGSIAAPFVIGIGGIIPLIVMGGLAIVGGLSGIFLPETLGLPLPSSLEQVNMLWKNSKPWWKWITKEDLAKMRQFSQ